MKFTPLFAIPLLLAISAGAGVTGETALPGPTFAVVAAEDPDYAVVSGIAPGTTLFGLLQVDAPEMVYATGGADPRGQALKATGTVFDFTDPNGAHWVVREYTFGGNYAYGVEVGEKHNDETIGDYNFVLIVHSGKLGGSASLFVQ